MCISIGGLHFDNAFSDFQDRDVERTASKVVHRDGFVLLLVQTVGERRSRGLIDDAKHFESGDASGIFCRLPLGIIEVCGDRDDRLIHLLAEVILCGALQLLKDHCGDLRWRVLLAHDFHSRVVVAGTGDLVGHHLHFFVYFVVPPAHEPLDRIDSIFGICDGLTLGNLPGEALTTLRKRHDRGRCASALLIGYDDRLPTFHNGDDGVGGAQVDPYNLAHRKLLLAACRC